MEATHIPAPGRSPRLLPAAVLLLCLLPLFLTPVLPSVDFYAHIVRYNVLAHPGADAQNYQPNWSLLPNLGVDILGTALLRIFPPDVAAPLLAALVILAPVAGTMRLSRALHGRVAPLTALLAGLLAYNLILFWGFANFLLGFGIALWSLGWWIAMRDRPRAQLLGMAAIGIVMLFIHGLVFALWGVMLAALEIGLAREAGRLRPADLVRRGLRLLALAVMPVFLFFQMRTADAEGGATGALGNLARIAAEGGRAGVVRRLWEELLKRLDSILRVVETSDPAVDRIFGALLWAGLATGFARGVLRYDRRLGPVAWLCFALIWIMPPNLFGVGHLDERIPLLFLAVVIAGLSVAPAAVTSAGTAPAGGGLHLWLPRLLGLLFPLHLVLAVAGMVQAGQFYRGYLAAIDGRDTGHLATAAFEGRTAERDFGRACTPLLFLLQLRNGTAVPTFAHPTQQPLRLAGPLAEAVAGSGGTRGRPLEESVPKLLAAGFDTIVACTENPAREIPGADILARGPGWVLYRAQ